MATDWEIQTKDLHAAYNAHDLEKFLSFHTDDVFFEHVLVGGTICRGKDEVREFIKSGFDAFPDIKCELTNVISSKDRQCEECIFSGTHKGTYLGIAATGKSLSFRAVIVRELRKGKTSRVSLYYDSAVLRQLGA